jgi:hypothetical protein
MSPARLPKSPSSQGVLTAANLSAQPSVPYLSRSNAS